MLHSKTRIFFGSLNMFLLILRCPGDSAAEFVRKLTTIFIAEHSSDTVFLVLVSPLITP